MRARRNRPAIARAALRSLGDDINVQRGCDSSRLPRPLDTTRRGEQLVDASDHAGATPRVAEDLRDDVADPPTMVPF